MVDILAFDCVLAFALRDSSASLISGSAILDLVRLTLIPIVLLLVVARVSRHYLGLYLLRGVFLIFWTLLGPGVAGFGVVSTARFPPRKS
jgi:hypothetical protein